MIAFASIDRVIHLLERLVVVAEAMQRLGESERSRFDVLEEAVVTHQRHLDQWVHEQRAAFEDHLRTCDAIHASVAGGHKPSSWRIVN